MEYEHTDIGRSFLVPIKGLIVWADKHHLAICAARKDHAAQAEA